MASAGTEAPPDHVNVKSLVRSVSEPVVTSPRSRSVLRAPLLVDEEPPPHTEGSASVRHLSCPPEIVELYS